MDKNTLAPPPTPQVSIPQAAPPPTPSTETNKSFLPPPLPQTETNDSSSYTFTNIPPINLESDSDQVTPIQQQQQGQEQLLRAGLSTKPRLILMTSLGSFWGFSMGAFLGAQQSGLQYLAENAHKLPTTVQGWYFYHKTKNYRMMLGGVKRGMRFAGKTGGLCLLYGGLEAALDDVRGEADVLNSVAAGVATGTIFSALTKLTRGSFRYSIFFGAMFGLAAGGLSDLHRYASGDTPAYGHKLMSLMTKEEQEKKVKN